MPTNLPDRGDQKRPFDAEFREGPRPGAGFDLLSEADLYDGLLLRRVIAYLIDVAILSVVFGILWFVLVVMTFGLLAPLLPLLALVPVLYHGYFVGSRSATLGMSVMGLEVRTLDGGRPTYLHAFLLAVIFFATIVPTVWLVLLVALFNPQRRTLHDWLVGTLVVRADAFRRMTGGT